jgi:hypothetical protein
VASTESSDDVYFHGLSAAWAQDLQLSLRFTGLSSAISPVLEAIAGCVVVCEGGMKQMLPELVQGISSHEEPKI